MHFHLREQQATAINLSPMSETLYTFSNIVVPARFERASFSLSEPPLIFFVGLYRWRDSNPRSHPCKGCALNQLSYTCVIFFCQQFLLYQYFKKCQLFGKLFKPSFKNVVLGRTKIMFLGKRLNFLNYGQIWNRLHARHNRHCFSSFFRVLPAGFEPATFSV